MKFISHYSYDKDIPINKNMTRTLNKDMFVFHSLRHNNVNRWGILILVKAEGEGKKGNPKNCMQRNSKIKGRILRRMSMISHQFITKILPINTIPPKTSLFTSTLLSFLISPTI